MSEDCKGGCKSDMVLSIYCLKKVMDSHSMHPSSLNWAKRKLFYPELEANTRIRLYGSEVQQVQNPTGKSQPFVRVIYSEE